MASDPLDACTNLADGTDLTDTAPPSPTVCANCHTPLQGPICHECGQKADSPLRHLPALLDDALDLIFNVDSRIVHTLPALFFRPGFLTLEYFAGRRIRYLPPFRSMFLFSVLAFLVMHFSLSLQLQGAGNRFSGDTSVAQVQERLDGSLAGLEEARKATGGSTARGLDKAEQMLREQATQRIAELTGTTRKAAPPEPGTDSVATSASADGIPATGVTPDSRSPALPASAPGPISVPDEPEISGLTTDMLANLQLLSKKGPARQQFVAAIFNALPPAMLVLLPLFALLLKFTYAFKRRLYIEHLIVALHSHAFIFLSLLLIALLGLLGHWLLPRLGWIETPLHWLRVAIGVWLPLYLLLMQKRVYRQSWLVTVLKYGFVGTCYSMLLIFTLIGVVMFSLQSL